MLKNYKFKIFFTIICSKSDLKLEFKQSLNANYYN